MGWLSCLTGIFLEWVAQANLMTLLYLKNRSKTLKDAYCQAEEWSSNNLSKALSDGHFRAGDVTKTTLVRLSQVADSFRTWLCFPVARDICPRNSSTWMARSMDHNKLWKICGLDDGNAWVLGWRWTADGHFMKHILPNDLTHRNTWMANLSRSDPPTMSGTWHSPRHTGFSTGEKNHWVLQRLGVASQAGPRLEKCHKNGIRCLADIVINHRRWWGTWSLVIPKRSMKNVTVDWSKLVWDCDP